MTLNVAGRVSAGGLSGLPARRTPSIGGPGRRLARFSAILIFLGLLWRTVRGGVSGAGGEEFDEAHSSAEEEADEEEDGEDGDSEAEDGPTGEDEAVAGGEEFSK